MKNSLRSLLVIAMFTLALLLPARSWSQTRPAIAEQIAKAYGVDSWGQIDAIRYTWHAQFPGVDVAHAWIWEPKTGKVSFQSKDKDGKPVSVTYVQSELSAQPAKVRDEVQPAFINDQYWLIFPYHVQWDTSSNVQDFGAQKLPVGSGTARHVVVKYPAEAGGFTPGDTWELWVGPTNRVQQFVYRRGGPRKPSVVVASWTDYKKAGPLLVAMDHRGTADGKPLRIFFTDVAVKLAGSDKWLAAQ